MNAQSKELTVLKEQLEQQRNGKILIQDLLNRATRIESERIIANMLKENTGAHMLDSGGRGGRHWEQNAGRHFSSEPAAVIEFSHGNIELTINTFHHLAATLRYMPTMDEVFQLYREAQPDTYDLEDMECFGNFLEYLTGEKPRPTGTHNSYNEDCALHQHVQTAGYIIGNDYSDLHGELEILIVQTHNGADIRGGYSTPRVFTLAEGRWPESGYSFGMWSDASIMCNECGQYWYTDDAYHWYEDGSTSGKQLNEYEHTDLDRLSLAEQTALWVDSHAAVPRPTGKIIVMDNGGGICPCCGQGYLDVSVLWES